MFNSQWPFIELYRSLLAYRGKDAYTDVLEPWLSDNADESRWIDDFQKRTNNDWPAATTEDLCRLYSIFRVTSTLLLGFQRGRADGTDYPGPTISIEGFQLFHEELGFHIPKVKEYHPFFHEILHVIQTPEPDAQIELLEYTWPCLMLSDMLFCRAGCSVSGGTSHVVKEIAESSKLYWTFRRKDRPHNDLSHGWGSNSQWRTAHRRDYHTSDRYHFNVDGRYSLKDPDCGLGHLPVNTRIELVRNRCLILTKIDDSDFFPYDSRYEENAGE